MARVMRRFREHSIKGEKGLSRVNWLRDFENDGTVDGVESAAVMVNQLLPLRDGGFIVTDTKDKTGWRTRDQKSRFRIAHIWNQYIKPGIDKETKKRIVVNKSILFPSYQYDFVPDIKGGQRCGAPAPNELFITQVRSKTEKRWMRFSLWRYVFGFWYSSEAKETGPDVPGLFVCLTLRARRSRIFQHKFLSQIPEGSNLIDNLILINNDEEKDRNGLRRRDKVVVEKSLVNPVLWQNMLPFIKDSLLNIKQENEEIMDRYNAVHKKREQEQRKKDIVEKRRIYLDEEFEKNPVYYMALTKSARIVATENILEGLERAQEDLDKLTGDYFDEDEGSTTDIEIREARNKKKKEKTTEDPEEDILESGAKDDESEVELEHSVTTTEEEQDEETSEESKKDDSSAMERTLEEQRENFLKSK